MKKKAITKLASLFLACLLLCLCVVVAGCAEKPLTLDEQLELGTRYLSELDYENAVIAFTAAIEIDPRSTQGYAGLYAAYAAQGDPEKAGEVWAAMLEAGVSADEMLSWVEKMAALITEGGGDGEAVKQAAQEKASENENEENGQPTAADGSSPAYIALQQKQIEVTVTPTDITADSVFNSDGYGSLKMDGEMGEFGDYAVMPQAALINSSGEFHFPYLNTEGRYYYNDNVVTLCSRHVNSGLYLSEVNSVEMGYYNNDGTMMLSADRWSNPDDLKRHYAEVNLIKENGIIELNDISVELHPFGDGVAFVRCCGNLNVIYPGSASFGVTSFRPYECYLIDKQGNILLTIPQEFSLNVSGLPSGYFAGIGGLWYSSEGLIQVGCFYRLGDHISDTTGTDEFFVDGQWVRQDWYTGREERFVYGFMDHSGNIVIPQMYLAVRDFSEGLAAVQNTDGLWGYIDKSNNIVIPFEYGSADSFVDGLAVVSKDGKTGYINAQNEIVIPFEYEDAFGAGGGVCTVARNGKYGLVDYNNNEVLPFEYDDISTCAEGVVYAIKDRQVYIITVEE